MSGDFCNWTSPSQSTPNINEASSKDIAASLPKNVLSWGVWQGPEQKESVFLGEVTHSVCSQTADRGTYTGVFSLSRSASVPDVVGSSPQTAFSSITIASRKVLRSFSTSRETLCPSYQSQPLRVFSAQEETFGTGILLIPKSRMRVPESQPDLCRQSPTIVTSSNFRPAYSPADRLAVSDWGKKKAQLVRHRPSQAESSRKQDVMNGSVVDLSSQPSYRSCVHLEVPLRSANSVLFLDKSLCISLVGLEVRRASQPTLFRSTFSIRLCGSSCQRYATKNKVAKTSLGYLRPRLAKLDGYKCSNQESNLGHCRGSLSKLRGDKVVKIAHACGVKVEVDGPDTQCLSAASGILSFRGPDHSNSKTAKQKGNADEAAFPVRTNSRHKKHTFITHSVESRNWSKQTRNEETKERQDEDSSTAPQKVFISEKTFSSSKANSLEETPQTLSLKEALELFRPDFISRSQGRVRRLEKRAMRRRTLQDSNPDLVQDLREEECRQRRKCTTPDPLSDNLFKPRERSISGREMQLRSRRIYNKLPEVTKKKEEEKKRAISQCNRVRADVFKKKLLDQILHR